MLDTLCDIEAIKRAAKAATPGPWHSCKAKWKGQRCTCGAVLTDDSPLGSVAVIHLRVGDEPSEFHGSYPRNDAQMIANADYIALMNPNTTLALIAELEGYRKNARSRKSAQDS